MFYIKEEMLLMLKKLGLIEFVLGLGLIMLAIILTIIS